MVMGGGHGGGEGLEFGNRSQGLASAAAAHAEAWRDRKAGLARG